MRHFSFFFRPLTCPAAIVHNHYENYLSFPRALCKKPRPKSKPGWIFNALHAAHINFSACVRKAWHKIFCNFSATTFPFLATATSYTGTHMRGIHTVLIFFAKKKEEEEAFAGAATFSGIYCTCAAYIYVQRKTRRAPKPKEWVKNVFYIARVSLRRGKCKIWGKCVCTYVRASHRS